MNMEPRRINYSTDKLCNTHDGAAENTLHMDIINYKMSEEKNKKKCLSLTVKKTCRKN